MPQGVLTINGQDAYTTWGISLDEQGLSRLMTPAPHKEPVQNKNMAMNGTHIVGAVTYKDVRTISLPMHIKAPTKAAFLQNYANFCSSVLDTGWLHISVSYLPGKVFHFIYEDCQQFSEFMCEMAHFTLSLSEPDPTNTSPL